MANNYATHSTLRCHYNMLQYNTYGLEGQTWKHGLNFELKSFEFENIPPSYMSYDLHTLGKDNSMIMKPDSKVT